MADLSHLGGLNEIEQLDLANYSDAKESTFRLPAKGRYTLRAPESFPSAAFDRTKGGSLTAQIDPTIIGGDHDGFTVRFVKVSAKVFKRGTTAASQAGDYLRACGVNDVVLGSEQQVADAIEATANAVYEANLDWRCYNTKTGFSLQGMERFPKNADGTYQSWIEDPTPGAVDENGNKYKVRANLVIPFGGFIAK